MKTIPCFLLAVALAFVGVSETHGQSGNAAAYSRIGLSPRIIAIGNAYVAGGSEGNYSYYNPALAALTTENHLDLSGASMRFDRSLGTLQATFPLPPNAGLSLDIVYAGVSNFDGRTQSGYHTEFFDTHDLQLGAAFGIALNPRLTIGTRITYKLSRYTLTGVETPSSVGLDLGLRYSMTDNTAIGFAIQELIGEFVWDTSDYYGTVGSLQTNDQIPTRIKAGIWHNVQQLPANLYLEFENRRITGQQRFNETAFAGTGAVITERRDDVTYSRYYLRAGISAPLHDRLVVRAGWQSGQTDTMNQSQRFSSGFSINLPFDLYAPSIDYVFVREPGGVSWFHMFSLRLNLNS